MKAVKLIVGILGIVATVIVLLETFASGTVNGIAGGALTVLGPKTGLILAAAFLVGSILGMIILRNKFIGVISGIIYLIGAAAGFYKMSEYKDARVWAIAAAVFGVIYILGSLFQKREASPAYKR